MNHYSCVARSEATLLSGVSSNPVILNAHFPPQSVKVYLRSTSGGGSASSDAGHSHETGSQVTLGPGAGFRKGGTLIASGEQVIIGCQADSSNPVAVLRWRKYRCGRQQRLRLFSSNPNVLATAGIGSATMTNSESRVLPTSGQINAGSSMIQPIREEAEINVMTNKSAEAPPACEAIDIDGKRQTQCFNIIREREEILHTWRKCKWCLKLIRIS
ncbi:unnamed protein product [Protopolystoma xenopodis]|uniref:Ig-like domain-containing protein n=1 Tax=Protopolystoma xenopodis TaxID=117903 RepID=A0A448XF86_9PLAT|nr:unnamed protein product [Protopolystoma xenopodis]